MEMGIVMDANRPSVLRNEGLTAERAHISHVGGRLVYLDTSAIPVERIDDARARQRRLLQIPLLEMRITTRKDN
jgi:hypothetical protein